LRIFLWEKVRGMKRLFKVAVTKEQVTLTQFEGSNLQLKVYDKEVTLPSGGTVSVALEKNKASVK
jgi:trehalose/maltose hydrolase-like predicted phosphorylase